MTPPAWANLKAIFQDAADLPVAERGAFLDHACAGDAALRAEVENLLAQTDGDDTLEIFSSPHVSALQTNELLKGRFRILRFIGKGGMGEVYEARDEELGGLLALKMLRPELNDDPTFLSRFRREVQLARQVTHPNVCRVFDVGRDQRSGRQLAFLTMELIDGENLAAVLRRRGRLDLAEALPLVRQMAAGLGALHEKGILHRDLKPANILITRTSSLGTRAVISDFGLARALAQESTALSQTGNVMGTPDYMAPEQLLGDPVTPATDIYSLGLVIYEMITGQRAFPGGRSLESTLQRVAEKPMPPRAHSALISTEWNAIVLRCLARDPAHRPASAAEILAALEDHPRPPARPRPHWLSIAAIVLALIAVVLWALRFGR